MKAIVTGSGAIGSAARKALEEKGHEVVSVGRKSGDYQADISHPESLKALFSRIGSFDAVANAAGDVSFGALEDSTDEQWANSIKFKGMGRIRGSLTLVSGVLTDEYLLGGTFGTAINHLVEGFAKGAAVELLRGLRINCISPTVLAESVSYHAYFAGFIPVTAGKSARLICARCQRRSPGVSSSCTRPTAEEMAEARPQTE
jgi:NAD(P)-dependent dehydrogenase (short-subunit alcohol dehydrogenase family)